MSIKRAPAKFFQIKELSYIRVNQIEIPFEGTKAIFTYNDEKLVRIILFGTVLARKEGVVESKGQPYMNFLIDDASGQIWVSLFGHKSLYPAIAIGTIVEVVGKLSIYKEQLSITAETVKTNLPMSYEIYRRTEFLEKEAAIKGFTEEEKIPDVTQQPDKDVHEVLGILYEAETMLSPKQIKEKSDLTLEAIKRAIISLMGSSRIYEPQKGYYKIL